MNSLELTEQELKLVPKREVYSFMERFMLRKFHPRKIFFDMIGSMWAVYFLWNHEWQIALAALILFNAMGILSAWNVNFRHLAQTPLGKLGLLHSRPANFSVQFAGVIVAVYGIWYHSVEVILIALTAIFAGHLSGWSKFDSRFELGRFGEY